MSSFEQMREEMVRRQLEDRGLRDPRLLDAMREVPREAFVPPEARESAYMDGPLSIGSGQTISQPVVVARMVDALELGPGTSVLEIGTGSGYSAAVMSRVAEKVYTIERHAELAEAARERLERLGYGNVEVRHGDGTKGWPEKAPFDAIVVTAAGRRIPELLKKQLHPGGRMVIPVGPQNRAQKLLLIQPTGNGFSEKDLEFVRFVPLVGEDV